MDYAKTKLAVGIAVLACAVATAVPAAAQQQVVPPPPILVTSQSVTINDSPGEQTDPHVSKDLVAYTNAAGSQIRYYRFSSGVDAAIPSDPTFLDILSDVSGDRVAFSRITPDRNAIMVFDTLTSSLTEIDPHTRTNRLGVAIGGNIVAFIDLSTGEGDVFAYDLGANPPVGPQLVSGSPFGEQNPNVAPDGNTIVWEQCPQVSITNCDVFKAVRVAGVWNTSAVANTPDPEGNPDTDGTWIAYDALRAGNPTGQDIYYQLVSGGPEVQLALPGAQQNPSVSKGLIGFESRATPVSSRDLFVYDIADNTLYQVTSTPALDESLNDISVLDNGDVRVVWAANDGAFGDEDIHGLTFTPISHQVSYQICLFYDPSVAKKSGSAYPIKLQLCDANGNNVSSASIVLQAVGVTQTSNNSPVAFDDTGNANPDFDFRYDATFDGYIFNLSTKGYRTGMYSLSFTAGADPTVHTASFAVK